METFEFYPLKEILEDFYISEIAKELDVDEKAIDYTNNTDVKVNEKELETLLSAKKLVKNEIYKNAECRVLNYLETFKCSKNPDVENYLHNKEKALRLQKESVSRTYLFINTENEDIMAYFSLAIKPVIIKENHDITKTKKKKMNIKKEDNIEICSTFLIGQIGRADNYTREDIDLKIILDYIFAVINKIRALIGGKIIMIEVEKEPKLIKRYEEFNFQNINSDSDYTQLMQWVNSY